MPRIFVAPFAQSMADNVTNKWVDAYGSVWMNPARPVGIHKGLRLKDAV